DSLAGQACFQFRSPIESQPGSLTVLLAVPVGLGVIPNLPDDPASLAGDPAVPDLPVPLPTGLPGLPGSSSSSSAASSSSSAASTTSSSSSSSGLLPGSSTQSSSAAADPRPHLQASADHETLGLRMGEQGTVVLAVRNDGDAADTVRITAQSEAPITFDTTTESMLLAPGEVGKFTVRITPTSAGSGRLDLFATGDKAATAMDSVLVAIEAAPSPAIASTIAASLDPTALHGAVGQASPVTVRIANQGSMADRVSIEASGDGVKVEPAMLDVLLQPGDSVARQIMVTPMVEGASQVVLRITSERGVDLQPLVLLSSSAPLDASNDASPAAQDDGGSDSKDSPGAGLLLSAAAVGLALAMRRKLRKT
ncbi:MAG: hypothetical protein QOC71_481, partial [Thermoplasmata archaeon]|nr:hypothetical protein [Thermoplasmata archaeon]